MRRVSVFRMAAARSWARADRAVCRQTPSQVESWGLHCRVEPARGNGVLIAIAAEPIRA